ncbi:MAG: hypothetical protein HOV80_04305 [Polyangiaceae bacterium]|nr:hypothetical protein [Polyangiaceae bacterium]
MFRLAGFRFLAVLPLFALIAGCAESESSDEDEENKKKTTDKEEEQEEPELPPDPTTHFEAELASFVVPVGGAHEAGFNDLSGEPGSGEDVSFGSQRWRMIDLDGDGAQDIVVTASAVPKSGYYFWTEVPGYKEGTPTWYMYRNNGAGFDTEPTAWPVPVGGTYDAGFNDLSGEPGSGEDVTYGSQRWRLHDIDGDKLPDIVVTASAVPKSGYYFWTEVPGYKEGTPTWYVYKNNGAGFDPDPIAWSVPLGGTDDAGFNDLSGEPGSGEGVAYGSQRWRTVDVDGDELDDIVVTASAVPKSGYYFWTEVPGYKEGTPTWYVFKNNGAGFDAQPIAWSLPLGGTDDAGFNDVSGEPGSGEGVAYGSQRWRLLDMDADKLPDIVVTASATPRSGYYFWTEVPGYNEGTPTWYIYRNNGSGFDADPTAWSVPQGGQHEAGFNDLGGQPGNGEDVSMGSDRWSVVDLNSDGRPDLVVTGEATPRSGYYYWVEVLGLADAPHWNVYLGEESGFAAEPQSWSVPTGGQYEAGFAALSGEPGNGEDVAMGADRWRLVDVDGDKRLDIVITGEATPRSGYYYWVEVPGYDSQPAWQIYRGAP